MLKFIITTVFFSQAFILCAFENDLRAVAKRPGKNELFIGGEFNTVVVVDNKTGKPIRNFQIDKGVVDLQFTTDGTKLLAAQAPYSGSVFIIDPETGSILKTIKGSSFHLFNGSTIFADVDRYQKKSVKIYDAATGDLQREIQCGFSPAFCGLSGDQKQLLIFGAEKDVMNESSMIKNAAVKGEGYNVYNSTYVSQEKDGKGCDILVADLATGSTEITGEIPY
jgi:hypothetical protein